MPAAIIPITETLSESEKIMVGMLLHTEVHTTFPLDIRFKSEPDGFLGLCPFKEGQQLLRLRIEFEPFLYRQKIDAECICL